MVLPAAMISMGFDRPAAALAGILTSIPIYLWWRRASRLSQRLRRLLGSPSKYSGRAVAATRILAVILLSLAASSPYVTAYRSIPVTLDNPEAYRDVPVRHIIVVDVSKSMGYRDIGEQRIQAARRLIRGYLGELGDSDNVTIMVFSSTVRTLCSGSPGECLKAVDKLRAGERYSALGDALARGILEARVSGIPGVVVLVSDGGWNYGADPRQVAERYRGSAPVVIVKVGHDPRARILYEIAGRMGVKVFSVDQFSLQALNDTTSELYKQAKYTALIASGKTSIRISYRNYDISSVLGIAGLALLIASVKEGV